MLIYGQGILGALYFMKKTLFFAFGLIGQIGFATAIPLVVFGLLGRYLDKQLGTSPYLTVAGFIAATPIVYFTIRKIVKDAMKEFEKLNNNNR